MSRVVECHGVLLLDKPAGYTSARAMARAKRFLAAAKAGHTGTLDPFATGLLPLVFGEATKFSRFLLDSRKAYEATLALGLETTTGDPEGEVVRDVPGQVPSEAIDAALAGFVGSHDQLPPMHSAVRVGGKRLYEYARAGEEIGRAPRRVRIESLRRIGLDGRELRVAVACSKGTYIRALAMDIGGALGCGASLVALKRTEVGPFRLADALGLEAIEADPEGARRRLLPVDVLVASLPRVEPPAEEARRFAQGQAIPGAPRDGAAELGVFSPGGRFLGVGRAQPDGRVAPLRLMSDAERRVA